MYAHTAKERHVSPISVNLTGVKTTPTPLEPGYYQAVVSKCEERTSDAGHPYVAWVFNVLEPEDFAGQKGFYNTTLQPQGLWSLKRLLIALGFSEEDLAGQVDFEPSDMLGMQCTLVVVEDVYKGETTGRVKEVLEAGITDEDEEVE